MNKNGKIDKEKINYLIEISGKIFRHFHIFIIILTIYISILVLRNLNVVNILGSILKILTPLFIGILIAWLLRPIVNYLEIKKINRIIALICVYIIIILFFFLCLIIFIPKFIKEFQEFINIFPNILNDFIDNFKIIDISKYRKEIFDIINVFIINKGKYLPITFINIIKGISSFIIGFVIGFYLLITNTVITINTDIKEETYKLIMKINSIFRNYVKGIFLSTIIVFILCTAIFYFVNLDNCVLFGFICGITNLIPFIGPYIGAIIPVLVAFTKNTTFGILIIVIIFIIQTLEGNVIQPIIMSKSVNIHPIVSIISLLIFGYFFGILGMIFAIPIVASLKEVYFYLKMKYNNYNKS